MKNVIKKSSFFHMLKNGLSDNQLALAVVYPGEKAVRGGADPVRSGKGTDTQAWICF